MSKINLVPSDENDSNKELSVEFTAEEKKKIEEYKGKINLDSTSDIVQYAVGSQSEVSSFSNEILKKVKTRELSGAENILLDLRSNIKSFDKSTKKKPLIPFFDSLKKKARRLKNEYTSVEKNIEKIELRLESHYKNLNTDIHTFDRLFSENQKYFNELSIYIAAGEQKIKEVREETLPQMKEEAESTNNPTKLQEYKDMEQRVVRFERKVHDLKLTRMVVLQTAPQIRMIQNNSSTLMEKIQSSLVNTIPLWKNQMVLNLGIAHAQRGLEAQRAVSEATNELLTKNSEMLKQATIGIAKEAERGIVDMETIKTANANIIETIDEVLKIQEEGRKKRSQAEVELQQAESELRKHLLRNSDNKER
ncbi:MAG TPA: toxic anion resistance protein [Sphingobacterium sp.]|nr:toxic anion resistance protein [Sphingobacterium sp.]